MQRDSALSLVASYFTVASVLVVYHLFALQTWSQRVELAIIEGQGALLTPVHSLQRSVAASKCKYVLGGYPRVEVIGLSCALMFLAVLTLCAATYVSDVPLIYVAGPALLLVGVVCGSSLAAWLRMGKAVAEVSQDLGES